MTERAKVLPFTPAPDRNRELDAEIVADDESVAWDEIAYEIEADLWAERMLADGSDE